MNINTYLTEVVLTEVSQDTVIDLFTTYSGISHGALINLLTKKLKTLTPEKAKEISKEYETVVEDTFKKNKLDLKRFEKIVTDAKKTPNTPLNKEDGEYYVKCKKHLLINNVQFIEKNFAADDPKIEKVINRIYSKYEKIVNEAYKKNTVYRVLDTLLGLFLACVAIAMVVWVYKDIKNNDAWGISKIIKILLKIGTGSFAAYLAYELLKKAITGKQLQRIK